MDTLRNILPRYYKRNEEKKGLERELKEDNAKIKEIMGALSISRFAIDDIEATISISERVNLIEDILLERLKEHGIGEGIIKTKEYVDMDALEDAIYNEKINPAILADAQEKKEVITLRVRRTKR